MPDPRPKTRPRAAGRSRIPELILLRGEAHGQRTPLKRGKRYRHLPTGRPCTYLAPHMPRGGGPFNGRVFVIFPGEHRRTVVPASSLQQQGASHAA